MWHEFQQLHSDQEFQNVVKAISAFDDWSNLVSSTNLVLSDAHLRNFCCPEIHISEDCCATSILVQSLEKLGGFGTSVVIHVLAQHTGTFAWIHRVLYAMSEEGIESLHSTIKEDFENVSRGDKLERARITIQGNAVQVQLADMGKSFD